METPADRGDRRSCGPCSLCCKVLLVQDSGADFEKPAGEWCTHCRAPNGCAIFDTDDLPGICRTWACAWRRGYLDEGERPDRSRVVVDVETSERFGRVWMLYEAWPGASLANSGAQHVLETLRATGLPVCIVRGPTRPRTLLLPNGKQLTLVRKGEGPINGEEVFRAK